MYRQSWKLYCHCNRRLGLFNPYRTEKIDVGTASSIIIDKPDNHPEFSEFTSLTPAVDIGIAAAGIIIALLALLLTRRKTSTRSHKQDSD